MVIPIHPDTPIELQEMRPAQQERIVTDEEEGNGRAMDMGYGQ